MATKQNSAITIDREAVGCCAEVGAQTVKELEPKVVELGNIVQYLSNPENLDGAEAEELRDGLKNLSNAVNIAFHRLQKLAQALKKIDERYGNAKKAVTRTLDQAKQEFEAIKMRAKSEKAGK